MNHPKESAPLQVKFRISVDDSEWLVFERNTFECCWSLRFFWLLFSIGDFCGSFLYFKVLVAAATFNFTVKQFFLECPFWPNKSYEVCTELLSRPEISGCTYVSALTLTIYFLRHFTGSNIVVINQRKTFWKWCTNIRVIIQRDVTKFHVVNLCSRYTFPET